MTHNVTVGDEARTARRTEFSVCALGLIVFILGVASWSVEAPDQPSAQVLRDFYATNQRRLALSACAGATAASGLIVFAAAIVRLLQRIHHPVETLAMWVISSAVVVSCLDICSAAIGFIPVVGEPSAQSDEVLLGWYALNRLSEAVGDLATFPRAMLLAAVGLAAVRYRSLPRWVGYYSLGMALLSLLGGFALTTLADPLSVAWLAALYGFAFWPLVVAMGLAFRRRKTHNG